MLNIILEILKHLFLNPSKSKGSKVVIESDINTATVVNEPTENTTTVVRKNETKPRTYITLEDWITSSGRYPARANSAELTDEVKVNAKDLIKKVNALLNDLEWDEPVSISSGFRPSSVNSAVPNAAKRSAHMTGKALDIFQAKPINKLGELIRKRHKEDKILKRHGLMMEALEHTIGKNSNWVHVDTVPRRERDNWEFKP